MPKSRPPYPEEFRRKLVALHRSGRSIRSLAREFEPTEQAIRNWIQQMAVDAGEREGLTTEEKAELTRLRREVRVLREERDILKKAAAWFARETHSVPEKGSSS